MLVQAFVNAHSQMSLHYRPESGKGIAQLVERPTEKPGAKLTRVRVPGAARDFSPRVSF